MDQWRRRAKYGNVRAVGFIEMRIDQAASGKLKTATEDKALPAESGPRDVVKLSKSEAEAAGAEAKAYRSVLIEAPIAFISMVVTALGLLRGERADLGLVAPQA